MDDVLLHPLTKQALGHVLQSEHHGLALVGPFGAGKGFLASKLAKDLLGKNFKEHSVFRINKQEAISIDDIRSLQSFLRLKTTGDGRVRRVAIIEDAHNLTAEAQNALLKTLEEPPDDTKIILTITDMQALRQTVYSRLQVVHVQPCTKAQVVRYFSEKGHDEETIKTAFLMSAGNMGLCSALIMDSQHQLVEAIGEAKEFLSASTYERLLKVDALAKDKTNAVLLLFALKRILSAASKGGKDARTVNAMASRLKTVYQAERALPANPNMKLLMTNLALNL